MFNRSEIMKRAWISYRADQEYSARFARNSGEPAQPVKFADSLKMAWMMAKAAVREAAIVAGPNGERVVALRAALKDLNYKSFRYSITEERRALEAELRSLIGRAA